MTSALSNNLPASLTGPADPVQRYGANNRFEAMLRNTRQGEGSATGVDDRNQQLETAAEQLLAMAFYQPLLKQAREVPFKSELFHGGFGEDAFGAQWDQAIAERLAKRDTSGLKQRLIEQMGGVSTVRQDQSTRIDRHG
jgi:Rod binding domain-containing protein